MKSPGIAVAGPAPAAEHRRLGHLGGGGLVLYAGTLTYLAAQWILALMIVRMLNAEALGVFSLAGIAVQALNLAATFGIDIGLIRFVRPAIRRNDPVHIRGFLRAALGLGLALAAPLAALVSFIFPLYMQRITALEGAWLTGALLGGATLLRVILSLLSSFVLAYERALERVLAERVLGPMVQVIVLYALLAAGAGFSGVMIAFAAGLLVSVALMAYFALRLAQSPKQQPAAPLPGAARQLLAFSWPQGLSMMVSYALMNCVPYLMGLAAGPLETGIYIAAYRLTLLGLLFFDGFGQIFAPTAAEGIAHDRLQKDFQRFTKWIVVCSLPVFIILSAFPRVWLMVIGPEFESGAAALLILSIAQLLNMLTGPGGVILAMRNYSGYNLLNGVVAWGATLALAGWLVPQAGAAGAAMAFLAGVVIMDVMTYCECWFLLRLVPVGVTLLKPAFIGFCAGVPFLLLAWRYEWALAGALALSVCFAAVYALALWWLGLEDTDRFAFQAVAAKVFRRGLSRASSG